MKVEYMEHMGSDLSVVNAARCSFGKESEWEYVPHAEIADCEVVVLSAKDTKLINYLAREKHVLPFRHPQVTLRIKVPIFLARQIGKHQVGMSWSEESRRYVTTEPEFFWPDKWRKAAENVKQGSSDEEIEKVWWTTADNWYSITERLEKELLPNIVETYNDMLKGGVAPELARMILPQSMYVTAVWTGSLLSFYQMYKLRSEAHAQKEARDFAEMVKEVIQPLYPESWKALEEHV